MNGRCENDALDNAEEICGICGGEFCSACVISTRNSKAKWVCKDCAIRHSGLRSGKKSDIATGRQVRKQRKALVSNGPTERGKNGFSFFDDADSDFTYDPVRAGQEAYVAAESEPVEVEPVVESRPKPSPRSSTFRRRFNRRGGRRKDDPAVSAEEEAASAIAPLPDTLLEDVLTPTSEGPSPDEAIVDELGQFRTTTTASDTTQARQPVNPTDGHKPTTATELLERLKESEEPFSRVAATKDLPTSQLDLNSSPFATEANPAPSTHPLQPPVEQPQVAEQPPVEQPPFGQQPVMEQQSNQDPFAVPVHQSPAERPQEPVADRPESTSTDLAVNPFSPPPPGSSVPATAEAVSVSGASTRGAPDLDPSGADTDADGNWIPPILRGMAPVVEREDSPLPQRRSAD